MKFALGQRWISDTESDLGLGAVVAVDGRMVTVLYPASGETRLYAQNEAPLTRVRFNIGDSIKSADGLQLQISAIKEQHDTLLYCGTNLDDGSYTELRETLLDHFISFNQPQDRLFAGQIDRFDWYSLRYQAWQHLHQQQQNPLQGLSGARVSLIPHQLYIANEVAQRYAPRILLADEVGLGKTIEAGFIIHQQLISGLASRVLIVVPDSLQHQWLVEMWRRFNLRFAIFDQERCEQAALDADNPFETEQLILCSLSFFTQQEKWHQFATQCHWDLLVVDEAHHLQWQPDAPSAAYQSISELASASAGVILLTATPDQLGHESHFARLRLLDPARFHSYDSFLQEEKQYQHIATAAAPLLQDYPLNAEQADALQHIFTEADIRDRLQLLSDSTIDKALAAATRRTLLSQLLDRHGTGRVLFRNSRSAIKGFPKRQVLPAPLEMPAQYVNALNVHFGINPQLTPSQRVQAQLCPEQVLHQLDANSNWCQFDPRVDYLLQLLKTHKHDKFLLICASAATAIALEEAVRQREGVRAAVFHEGMSIVERDKAAAYFAQQDYSAQLLLCSEIGSEGRNFQFAHHLVLFDLPLNPDLLEQRIGRLDRIGQTADIQLHVPYFQQQAQQGLFDWYHRGLDALEHTCQTGRTVFEQLDSRLLTALQQYDAAGMQQLIDDTRQINQQLKQQLEQGRDRLLEINSAGGDAGAELAQRIAAQDNDTALPMLMFKAWDLLGINQEDRSDTSIILTPSEQMQGSYPWLGDEGVTVTFDRPTALAEEDIQLLSWDHPMVRGTLDILSSDVHGSSSVAILPNKALPAGSYLLELNFIIEASAPPQLQLQRYLPATPLRVLLDKGGNNLAAKVSFEQLNKQLKPVGRQTGSKLAGALQTLIHPLIGTATTLAEQTLQSVAGSAQAKAEQALTEQLNRLEALRKHNPAVRQDELDAIAKIRSQLRDYIAKARVKLDAIRLIVVSHD